MPPLINPLPIAFIIATTFGVLMHDTQTDHAAMVAITNPAPAADFASSEVVSKSNEHVHVEKVSVSGQAGTGTTRMNTPRTQVRDDDHRYIQSKKAHYNGGDSTGLWPSV